MTFHRSSGQFLIETLNKVRIFFFVGSISIGEISRRFVVLKLFFLSSFCLFRTCRQNDPLSRRIPYPTTINVGTRQSLSECLNGIETRLTFNHIASCIKNKIASCTHIDTNLYIYIFQ